MTDATIQELLALAKRAERIQDSAASWETKHGLIFSWDLAHRVTHVLDQFYRQYERHERQEYPDHEEDVRLYVISLRERADDLGLTLDPPVIPVAKT